MMADGNKIIPVGRGGFGKGGAKGGGINEFPNTLRSRQVAKVLDLLGEGVIEGLVDGMKSIIFDTVPVQNDDGSFNAQGFAVDWRLGSPNQNLMTGFPGIQQEIPVGVQIKKNLPHTVRIDNPDVNRVRITVRVPSLTRTETDGTIKGSAVTLSVWHQSNGGGFQKIDGNTIKGKTTGPYQRALTYSLTGDPPWDVRVVRETDDSTKLTEQNDLYWDSYAELIDARIRYRNSAYVGISIDAEQFSSIPQRMYDVKGKLIQIPTNYDPIGRVYSPAIWNGTFKTAWSNNPAWVFYDAMVNPRYGLGDFITPDQIDKWALYSIGQWCDEPVADGKGGNEPRWTFNGIISDRQEAFDMLQSLASVFRGAHYWSGGVMTPVADKPGDFVGEYTNASVEAGDFTYQGSDRRARHTQAAVGWSDPTNLGQRKIALVEDQDGIQRYGLNRTDLVAIGCTSEGQAHRIGKWTLYTELNEGNTVSFRVGLEGAWCRPGDIIQISDITVSGERRGGRTLAGDQTTITLDGPVTFHELTPAFLSCVVPHDAPINSAMRPVQVETKQVIVPALEVPVQTLTVASPFSAQVGPDRVWILTTGDLEPTLWRVINVEEDEFLYRITGVAHDPGKWNFVERNIILAERDISNRPKFDVTNLAATESLVQLSAISVGAVIILTWQSAAPFFDVDWRPVDGNWTKIRTVEQTIDIPISTGQYEFRVTPIDIAGFKGKNATLTYTVLGLAARPADVIRFRVQIVGNVAMFQWAAATDLDVIVGGFFEMRYSPDITAAWIDSNPVIVSIPGTATTAELPNRPGIYLIKAIDSSGLYSQNAATITSTAPDTTSKQFVQVCEHPLWQGSKVGTQVFGPGVQDWLVLGQTGGLWDDQATLIDTWPTIDILPFVLPPQLNFGVTNQVGTYNFFNRIDLGGVFTTVLTVQMEAFPYFANSPFIDSRPGNVDSWQDWDDMDEDATGAVMIQIRQTDTDPSASPVWSPWSGFISGDYTARAFEFQAVLVAPLDQQVAVESLCVTADLRGKADSDNDITWAPTGSPSDMNIAFAVKFYEIPSITIQIQDGITGDYAVIPPSLKSRTGFAVELRNASNALITGRTPMPKFDWQALGY